MGNLARTMQVKIDHKQPKMFEVEEVGVKNNEDICMKVQRPENDSKLQTRSLYKYER